MRVVLFIHDTEIVRVCASAEPLDLLAIDHESGASVIHKAKLDIQGVRDAFALAGCGELDLRTGVFVAVERTCGGVVHLLADTPNIELLICDKLEPSIPIWIGSVDPARVEDLFASARTSTS